MMMKTQIGERYNSTLIVKNQNMIISVGLGFVREINGRLQIMYANSPICTGWENKIITQEIPGLDLTLGDSMYDIYYRKKKLSQLPYKVELEIRLDNGAFYYSYMRS